MALARLLGFDLCPRLKVLSHRRLFVVKAQTVPNTLAPIVQATVETDRIAAHWDRLVQLAAAVATGQTSAVTALTRFGSAARGDPLYEAGVLDTQGCSVLKNTLLKSVIYGYVDRRFDLTLLATGSSLSCAQPL